MRIGEIVYMWLRSLGELLTKIAAEDNPGFFYSLDDEQVELH